ncbi:hypothetical protein BKA62DRAFT_761817 [Auriculariales sp. MPI-PUGE-AT-0066]|nr:hypothetical protein BKA62DRAFT_761817 [Auriculariales sp. MPI-PUGE-AT-0066]
MSSSRTCDSTRTKAHQAATPSGTVHSPSPPNIDPAETEQKTPYLRMFRSTQLLVTDWWKCVDCKTCGYVMGYPSCMNITERNMDRTKPFECTVSTYLKCLLTLPRIQIRRHLRSPDTRALCTENMPRGIRHTAGTMNNALRQHADSDKIKSIYNSYESRHGSGGTGDTRKVRQRCDTRKVRQWCDTRKVRQRCDTRKVRQWCDTRKVRQRCESPNLGSGQILSEKDNQLRTDRRPRDRKPVSSAILAEVAWSLLVALIDILDMNVLLPCLTPSGQKWRPTRRRFPRGTRHPHEAIGRGASQQNSNPSPRHLDPGLATCGWCFAPVEDARAPDEHYI